MGSGQTCTYVTRRWGIHDERWAIALQDCGFSVTAISLEREGLSVGDLRDKLENSTKPILAGPLDVAHGLLGIDAPLFALSWGFDLIQANQRCDDLSWMTNLSGLIVDSRITCEIACGAGVAPERIHKIPWGVDLGIFTPTGPPANLAALGVPRKRKVILSLRAHEHVYRVGDVLRGFAQTSSDFPDAHLVVGNEGSLRTELEQLGESLRLADKLTFIGLLRENELPGLLRAADIYVTASETDGSSVTLLQAMACETSVLASDIAGNSEWITAGVTGDVFRLGDSASLAFNLTSMLANLGSERMEQMRAEARQRVLQFADWSRNGARLAAIMQQDS